MKKNDDGVDDDAQKKNNESSGKMSQSKEFDICLQQILYRFQMSFNFFDMLEFVGKKIVKKESGSHK